MDKLCKFKDACLSSQRFGVQGFFDNLPNPKHFG
jgi:hypothetical protein